MGMTRGFGVDIGGSGIKGGLVDLEAGALDGLTTTQLADYAAMRLFASTDPSR